MALHKLYEILSTRTIQIVQEFAAVKNLLFIFTKLTVVLCCYGCALLQFADFSYTCMFIPAGQCTIAVL